MALQSEGRTWINFRHDEAAILATPDATNSFTKLVTWTLAVLASANHFDDCQFDSCQSRKRTWHKYVHRQRMETKMEWLSQNWLWIIAGIGLFYFMTRMHGAGMGCGSHGSRSDHAVAETGARANSGTAIDPVSGRTVKTGDSAISMVYRDRAYYFENRNDRDSFESEPEKYLAGAPETGQAIARERPRRRGGC